MTQMRTAIGIEMPTERIRNSRDKVPNQYSYGHAEQYPHRKITLKCIYAFA